MSIKNIIIVSITAIIALFVLVVASPSPVSAAGKCGKASTTIISCSDADPIADLAKNIIVILTSGIGVIAVGAVIYGAILYSSAGGSSSSTGGGIANIKKAKEIWVNVVIGLVLFAFMVLITNFLIPGGVFK